jgi:hypothetical protein
MSAFLPALLAATGMLVAGCAVTAPNSPPPPDPPGTFVALTAPIVALGDTQEHESTGFPLVDDDSAVDSYVEVAQRPPEAPLFSRRILEWVVENHAEEPVLHLGDVLDMSCRSELRRAQKLALAMRQPGAILPGNHDGLLFGIFNYDVRDLVGSEEARRWNMGCRTPIEEGVATVEQARGQAVTKRDFITAYLELLAAKFPPGFALVPPRGEGRRSLSWRAPAPAFVEAIEARLADDGLYSGSFLAQQLALPAAPGAPRKVKVIGLDTNQVLTLVGALDTLQRKSPGDMGSVDADQVAAITPWVEEAVRSGDIVVFAGHHNWSQLGLPGRLLLGGLMRRLDHPLVYLSAHTHRGFWAEHDLGGRPLLELNVSSLSDWPIAYRRVSFHHDAQANRLKVVAALMPSDGEPPRSDADLLMAWTRQTCAKAGVQVAALAGEEIAAVRRQKGSRGTLWEWLWAHFDRSCEGCLRILFDHAHQYQDQLLSTIAQMEADIGSEAGLSEVRTPSHCEGRGVTECAAGLQRREAGDLPAHIANFRDKARLVDRVNEHLDDLSGPHAKAYMTCRAVIGAKTDFDETPEEQTPGRSEEFRRAASFFRTEATVGMR